MLCQPAGPPCIMDNFFFSRTIIIMVVPALHLVDHTTAGA